MTHWMSFSLAHVGHGAQDLVAGLVHPMTGWDHAAALVAVGVWASQQRGRAGGLIPVAFLGAMVVGGALAGLGVRLPGVETGILASVFIFGLLVAGVFQARPRVAALLAAGVSLFHGHAHVAELGGGESLIPYVVGFLTGSAAVLGAGLFLGRRAAALDATRVVRWLGAATAVAAAAIAVSRF